MMFLIGVIPGILVAFGMGGGSLLIYLLSAFQKNSQQVNQYINLWFYIVTGAYTIFMYNGKGKIDVKGIASILPYLFIASTITGVVAKNIDTGILKKFFGIFLILIGVWQVFQVIYMYIKEKKEKNILG